jgi:hypothetical protein
MMFKLIGMAVGVGLVLCTGIILFDAPKTQQLDSFEQPEHPEPIIQTIKDDMPDATNLDNQQAVLINAATQALQQAESTLQQSSLDVSSINDQEQQIELSFDQQPEPNETEKQQYLFWKPFASQGSANGFAKRLTEQTGIEMSVISIKYNQHSVSFSYADDDEKQRMISTINEKTGLNLGEI